MENFFNNPMILLTAIFSFIVVSIFFVYKLATRKKVSAAYKNNVTDTQKRITPKPGRREYKLVNKIECYQEELTWDQDVAAIKIIKQFKIDSIIKKYKDSGDVPVDELLALLTEHNALEQFMDVIMTVTYRPPGAAWKFYNSELRVIFTDFFTLNPESKMILEIMRLAAGITLMKDSQVNTATKADQT